MAFELIPLKNLEDQIRNIPTGSTVSITCSPAKTIEDTLDFCERLGSYGFSTIPHIAARMVEGEAHVDQLVARITGLEIRKVFVIGGDAEPHGQFTDAAGFLRSFLDRKPDIDVVGVGSYPDGHGTISDDTLAAALLEKQEIIAEAGLEGYMSTQMCFDHQKIGNWLAEQRAGGVTLPCHLGGTRSGGPHAAPHHLDPPRHRALGPLREKEPRIGHQAALTRRLQPQQADCPPVEEGSRSGHHRYPLLHVQHR